MRVGKLVDSSGIIIELWYAHERFDLQRVLELAGAELEFLQESDEIDEGEAENICSFIDTLKRKLNRLSGLTLDFSPPQ